MNLILDFGNTQKKIALFDSEGLILVESHEAITKDIIVRFIDAHPGITSCILSSVVRHSPEITGFLRKKMLFFELDENTPIPLRNRYETRKSQGRDRIAAAVGGAYSFPGKNVLVINAGTALTFDLVTENGDYLGGSISPGMQMRFNALHTFTEKLPLLFYQEHAELVGSTTQMSILSGVIHGIVAEIEGISQRYMERFPDLKIILSGGDSIYLVNRLKISIFALPNIVIHGLQQILAFNVNKAS
jgi:type III pantothenate kinase